MTAQLNINWNNEPNRTAIDGKVYAFRSKLEMRWACHLELMKTCGEIQAWYYEKIIFYFKGETTAPVRYRPDFLVVEKDNAVKYHECKGWLVSKDITKFKRAVKHYDAKMTLVMAANDKRAITRRAEKYCERVIFFKKLLKGQVVIVIHNS